MELVCCSKCNFRAPSVPRFFIHHFYELANNAVVEIPTMVGWCHDCESLGLLESGDLDLARMRADEIADDLEQAINQAAILDSASWFRKLFLSRKSFEKRRERVADLTSSFLESEDLVEAIKVRGNRQLKCLKCGGADTERFAQPFALDESSSPTSFASHPNCGGVLYESYAAEHISVRSKRAYYSTNGDLLYED